MGSGGGKGGGGGGSPQPTAEYQQYVSNWRNQNTPIITKQSFQTGGFLGKSKQKGFSYNPFYQNRQLGPNEARWEIQNARDLSPEQKQMYIAKVDSGELTQAQLKSVMRQQGEYTGTPMLDEAGYYVDKQNRQQKKLQDDMTRQQNEFNTRLEQMQKEQATLLTQQQEALAAQQREAYLKNQRSTRDSLYTDRMAAEEASIDYINNQIEKEKSNASLFGMKYEIKDEDKKTRINDYFASIWDASSDDKLKALLTEVGKPDNFVDFSLERGSGATIPKPQDSSQAESKVVGASKGAKKKSPTLSSLLDPAASPMTASSSTTLLGG
jgi:hypothetical protein